MIKQETISKITKKTAVIGIVGLGYVGLPLMLRFIDSGYKVIGFDIDQAKVNTLNRRKSYIRHITSDNIGLAVDKGFIATTDFSKVSDVDAIIICVPTPLNKYREPDLSFVINTMKSVLPYIKTGQIISLESTTYPGTTEEELKPLVESRGRIVGKDIFLIFSPEREDPGNTQFSTQNIPKVCGGVTPSCLELGVLMYSQIVDKVVPVSSTRAAEMTKLLENIHRSVNIGLVNEMKRISDKMGIDIHEVIRAAATKPFGFEPYFPGPGLGGHCIPIDPFYLAWKAREYGVHSRFIELAGEVNSAMPEWVFNKVVDGLNSRSKSIMGSKILILGIAYKKNVDDMRESPALAIMEMLRQKGADISYSDPYVPTIPKIRKYQFSLESVPCNEEIIASYDCVIIVTNHDVFDYEMIREKAILIVDTRGVYSALPATNIIRA